MENDKKGFIGLIILVMGLLIILLIGLFVYNYPSFYAENFLLGKGGDESSWVVWVVDYCNNDLRHDDEIEKIQCVHSQTNTRIIYQTSDRIVTPEELENGVAGDCTSWTNYYKVIFDKMGISNQPVLINKNEFRHMYLVAYTNIGYCSLDLEDIHCRKMEN